MGSIALEGLDFFAYHGVHLEERIIGNRYTVDVEVGYAIEKAGVSDNIQDTLDYGELYSIIQEVMQVPVNLLEHIAHKIMFNIEAKFTNLTYIHITIAKHNPPLGGLCKVAKIKMSKQFA